MFKLLIAAVIIIESGGNPDAISHKQARGLMQITDIGEKEVRNQYPDLKLSKFNPFIASHNKLFGSRLMRFYLSEVKGDVREALTLYNGGYAALRARRRGNPFPETKQYVIKVCRLYRNCDNKLLLGPIEDWGYKGKLTTVERIPSWNINQ